jgi:peptide/nickel transport system permease protein
MLGFIAGRLISLVASLAVASLVIFTLVEVIPGDPAAFLLGLNAAPEAVAALRTEMGLDQPKVVRYFAWVGGMLTGDFGTSLTYKTPVADMVADRLWVSLPLAISVDRISA